MYKSAFVIIGFLMGVDSHEGWGLFIVMAKSFCMGNRFKEYEIWAYWNSVFLLKLNEEDY
jgi:hypothetical protein